MLFILFFHFRIWKWTLYPIGVKYKINQVQPCCSWDEALEKDFAEAWPVYSWELSGETFVQFQDQESAQ